MKNIKKLVRSLRRITRQIDKVSHQDIQEMLDQGLSNRSIIDGYVDEVIYVLKTFQDER